MKLRTVEGNATDIIRATKNTIRKPLILHIVVWTNVGHTICVNCENLFPIFRHKLVELLVFFVDINRGFRLVFFIESESRYRKIYLFLDECRWHSNNFFLFIVISSKKVYFQSMCNRFLFTKPSNDSSDRSMLLPYIIACPFSYFTNCSI